MTTTDSQASRYESWVRDYGEDIYRCAFRLCGQHDSAEELTQETFFHAWRSVRSLREPQAAKFWLLGILRHRYMHWLRDRKRLPESGAAAETRTQQLTSAEDGPGDALERHESLQAALDGLEERYKTPFLLVFLEGFTCQQAADFLNVPLGTVLSRIHRVREATDGVLHDTIDGQPIILTLDSSDAVRAWQVPHGANVVHTFWFAWAAFHPETEVFASE